MKKLIFGLGICIAGFMNPMAAHDYYFPCDAIRYSPKKFGGFYLGGNLGVITQIAFRNEDIQGTGVIGKTYIDTDLTMGGQLGFDRKCGYSLLGVIVDGDWSNLQHTYTTVSQDQLIENLDWYLTMRGRAGMTVWDCLFYLSAGAAVARFDTTWNPDDTGDHFHKDDSRWGWTGSIGVEYFLKDNWSAGVDILYMQFSNSKKPFIRHADGGTNTLATSNSVFVGRVVLNYHIGNLLRCLCYR